MICSGTSEPHLKAIASDLRARLREEHDVAPHGTSGDPASQWIVLDYSDVIIHVLHQEKREYYALEDLWSDAPRLALA